MEDEIGEKEAEKRCRAQPTMEVQLFKNRDDQP